MARLPDFQSYQNIGDASGTGLTTISSIHINDDLGFEPILDNCIVSVTGEFLVILVVAS